MKIINEKNVGKEIEVQFEFDEDEYDILYERYLEEKKLKENPNNYSFSDFLHEVINILILEHECEILKKELKEQEEMLKFKKDELKAKIDGINS